MDYWEIINFTRDIYEEEKFILIALMKRPLQ